MSDLCVFTTGKDLSLLRESCDRVGIELRTYDAPWTTYVDVKMRKGVEFLKTVNQPYSMWVDGHDTLVMQPEKEILRRWRTYYGRTAFAAERTCWPDPSMETRYPPGVPPRFLQAGAFIGRTAELVHIMEEAQQGADWDDTLAWVKWYVDLDRKYFQPIIDSARLLFSSVSDGDEALQADSCVYHWNGHIPGREDWYRARTEKRKCK